MYILEKTNFKNKVNIKDDFKILFLSAKVTPDYLRCLTLHGFKSLFGSNCHDYPKIQHVYKTNNVDYTKLYGKRLYGKGITYSNNLEQMLHNDDLDNKIEETIQNKYYDIVIYDSCHANLPYFELVNKIYDPNEIILLCGKDIHKCNYTEYVDKNYNIFVREL